MKKGSRLIVEVIAFSALTFIGLFLFQDINRDAFFKVHHYSFSSECELCLSGQEPLTPAHSSLFNEHQSFHLRVSLPLLLSRDHLLIGREKSLAQLQLDLSRLCCDRLLACREEGLKIENSSKLGNRHSFANKACT